MLISRTGWSSELGYEVYLTDGAQGSELWDYIMAAGQPYGLKPGHTSSIRRIEAGMLSYQADLTIDNNPFEMGLDRLVDLDGDADFIAKDALRAIQAKGVTQRQVGLIFDGPPIEAPTMPSGPYPWTGNRWESHLRHLFPALTEKPGPGPDPSAP